MERRVPFAVAVQLGIDVRTMIDEKLHGGGTAVAAGHPERFSHRLGGDRLALALSGIVEALGETTRTSMFDPWLLIGGPALLMSLAFVACYLPARRSTHIDPVTALRAE